MARVWVRPHLRRHVQVPVKGAVPLYHECEIPFEGVNEHGIEFEQADWAEVRRKYGTNEKRRRLLGNLDEFLTQLRDSGIKVHEVAIYGSFISDRPEPGDIDVAIWHGGFGERMAGPWSLAEAKREHGVDAFPVPTYKMYCNWLAHPRESGSTKVVRIRKRR